MTQVRPERKPMDNQPRQPDSTRGICLGTLAKLCKTNFEIWKQRKPTVTRSVRQRLWVWWILNHFDLAKVSLWAEGAAPYYSHLFGHVWIFEHGANANSTFHSIGRVSNGLERLPVAVSLRLHCGHSFHDSCLDRWFEERRLDEKQWIMVFTWTIFKHKSSSRLHFRAAHKAMPNLQATLWPPCWQPATWQFCHRLEVLQESVGMRTVLKLKALKFLSLEGLISSYGVASEYVRMKPNWQNSPSNAFDFAGHYELLPLPYMTLLCP